MVIHLTTGARIHVHRADGDIGPTVYHIPKQEYGQYSKHLVDDDVPLGPDDGRNSCPCGAVLAALGCARGVPLLVIIGHLHVVLRRDIVLVYASCDEVSVCCYYIYGQDLVGPP